MEYIPERMDVPFVRICLLKYLARYVSKWKGFDEKLFSTSKINRDRNRDCIKVCDGFRGVWNKWKKSCHANKVTHQQWIWAVLDNSKKIFEREVNRDLSGLNLQVVK